MASLTWPQFDVDDEPFPQRGIPEGFKHTMPRLSESFEPDLGPPIVRRLTGDAPHVFDINWLLHERRLRRLELFWMKVDTDTPHNGCGGGSIPFNLAHPWDTTRTLECLMPIEPMIVGRSGTLYVVATRFFGYLEV